MGLDGGEGERAWGEGELPIFPASPGRPILSNIAEVRVSVFRSFV